MAETKKKKRRRWKTKTAHFPHLTKQTCSYCEGCGKVTDDRFEMSWVYFEGTAEGKRKIKLGWANPKPCPQCFGTGEIEII